ncbi:MAG: hypothetical protein BWX99_02299 [Deltaproteobacteria bacterium ADurb.Bin151]|nr:MAG: hypothetical protein BWX99_02299 [Deltaproteobacteria bacterium ADurb.Bin151]
MMVAPAIAAKQDGGIGTQTSSQISKNKLKFFTLFALKIRFAPKGISFCPASVMVDARAVEAGENCLAS